MTPEANKSIDVEVDKVNNVLTLAVASSKGPIECYAILVGCIHKLNFELSGAPCTIDELISAVALSLRTITAEQRPN